MVHIPPKPKNDAEFLEVMSKIIFISGFRWDIVNSRWPKIRKAFHNFNIGKWVKEIQKKNKKEPLFNPTVRDEMKQFAKIGNITSRWLAYVVTRDRRLLDTN